jgi:hypothetical protein
MQTLHPINVPNPDKLSLSEIKGDYDGPIRRYCFSTAETREIANRPEVMGMEYTEKLEAGMMHLLQGFKPLHFTDIEDVQVDVFNFLRGGLNFGLRNALHRAYGWNLHRSSFLSSQRARDEEGRWYITEDSYRKITIAKGGIVFCGDVIATGVTLHNGLVELTKEVKKRGASIRYFHFFTIGCHKAEKILEEFYDIWKKEFPDFEGMDVFYIEGKFHLADSKTPTTIKLPGTDLLRRDSVLMPEFIESQNEDVAYALERCTIYDAGSRAYDVEEYAADVMEYWEEVQELAEHGMTALAYLEERFPEASDVLKATAKKTDLVQMSTARVAFFKQHAGTLHRE